MTKNGFELQLKNMRGYAKSDDEAGVLLISYYKYDPKLDYIRSYGIDDLLVGEWILYVGVTLDEVLQECQYITTMNSKTYF